MPESGQRLILVVETKAGGEALLAAAAEQTASGPCRFMVLAPQFGNRGQTTGDAALTRMYQSFRPGLLGPDVDHIERPVRRRVAGEVGSLRSLGMPVEGDVVSEPLIKAIGRYVHAEAVDT